LQQTAQHVPLLISNDFSLEDVNLKNKRALYELMVRDGWYLPKLNSKFMN